VIALVITANQLAAGDYVLRGTDVPRWQVIEEIEEVSLEAQTYLRLWFDRPTTYHDLSLTESVVIGRW
jgi:hypothetical protein